MEALSAGWLDCALQRPRRLKFYPDRQYSHPVSLHGCTPLSSVRDAASGSNVASGVLLQSPYRR
jgi:hypothetical protein